MYFKSHVDIIENGWFTNLSLVHPWCCCCCCLPTPPCLFGGVLPYFEVTGHPVPISSLGFKCPDCFI